MFVKSLLVPSTGLLLIISGLLGCTTLADLGVAVPYIGEPPVISIEVLTQKPKGAVVHIQGKVKDYAPFLKGGAYLVQDKSGEIWIRTEGKPPRIGQEIIVKGKIDYENISVGNQELGGIYISEVEQLQAVAATKPQASPSPSPVVSQPTPALSQREENSPPDQKKPKPDPIDSFFLPHKQDQKL